MVLFQPIVLQKLELVTCIWCTFDLLVFKVIWGHSVPFGTGNLGLEGSGNMYIYMGTFDLLLLKIIWGSFSALVSKRPLNRKWLARGKWSEMWVSRYSCNMHMGNL